jgi:GNAT superfamily N-acetyltransferase
MFPAIALRLRKGITLAAKDPKLFIRFAAGRWERYAVFSLDPGGVSPPADLGCDYQFRFLADPELRDLCANGPEFLYYRRRLAWFGCSNVYALFCRGELAHLASLVSPQQDRRLPLRLIRLQDGEAEIAACLTMPAFRGRGLYPYVIRRLCWIAAQQGVERVLMTTMAGNKASRRGIEKAGFHCCGYTYRIILPGFPYHSGLLYRWRKTNS